NGDAENFFGPVVGVSPLAQNLAVQNLDASRGSSSIEVRLQGVTVLPHAVRVLVNGTSVGQGSFSGQTAGRARLPVPLSLLREGANQVTLTAEGGPIDVSLLDSLRL